MPKSDKFYLENIIEEVDFLLNESKNVSEEKFSQNIVLQKAFCRSFEVIGEASKQVSPEFKNSHPEIEWASLARTRDKVIHHYFDIDYFVLWDTVISDLPQLKIKLDKILSV